VHYCVAKQGAKGVITMQTQHLLMSMQIWNVSNTTWGLYAAHFSLVTCSSYGDEAVAAMESIFFVNDKMISELDLKNATLTNYQKEIKNKIEMSL
jgi:hypothetical protein